MSKTLLSILIIAGVVIVFVVARFTGIDNDQTSSANGNDIAHTKHMSEFDVWIIFQPEDQSFKVALPREPAHISEDAHDSFGLRPKKYDIYAADGLDKKGYMVEIIRFPKGPDPETDDQILQSTLDDILSHSTLNQLEDSKKAIFKGTNSLSFKIDSGERKLHGVIFVKNKTLYVLTRISPDDYADESEDYQYFIESIEFPEKKNHKDPS